MPEKIKYDYRRFIRKCQKKAYVENVLQKIKYDYWRFNRKHQEKGLSGKCAKKIKYITGVLHDKHCILPMFSLKNAGIFS